MALLERRVGCLLEIAGLKESFLGHRVRPRTGEAVVLVQLIGLDGKGDLTRRTRPRFCFPCKAPAGRPGLYLYRFAVLVECVGNAVPVDQVDDGVPAMVLGGVAITEQLHCVEP